MPDAKSSQIDQASARCAACGSLEVAIKRIRNTTKKYKDRELDFTCCEACGFAFSPSNAARYENESSFAKSSRPDKVGRSGDGVRGGREFFMLKTAQEILGRGDLSVLVFGPGLSRDHELIAKTEGVRECRITDLGNFQESDAFVPFDAPGKFDVIVACEVAEHFQRPREEFAHLLACLKPGGLLIVSTNISDGGSLAKLTYPFIPGHVSYYSGSAMIAIAKQNGFQIDFRMPQCVLGEPGIRKRYILFYEAPEIAIGIARFFARVPYAYSEPLPT